MKQYGSKIVLSFFIVAFFALSCPGLSHASRRTEASARRRLTALILEVDQKARTLVVRESFGGAIMRIIVPDEIDIQLSEFSPTMGHSHLINFDWAMPGMMVDLYVVPTIPLAAAKRSVEVAREGKNFSGPTPKAP